MREHEAELVTCSDDVIALMDDHAPALFDTDSGASQRPDPLEDLGEREKICLNALTVSKPLDVGTIASRAGLTITGALSSLTVLDLAGLAERRDTGWVKLRVRR